MTVECVSMFEWEKWKFVARTIILLFLNEKKHDFWRHRNSILKFCLLCDETAAYQMFILYTRDLNVCVLNLVLKTVWTTFKLNFNFFPFFYDYCVAAFYSDVLNALKSVKAKSNKNIFVFRKFCYEKHNKRHANWG